MLVVHYFFILIFFKFNKHILSVFRNRFVNVMVGFNTEKVNSVIRVAIVSNTDFIGKLFFINTLVFANILWYVFILIFSLTV